jgi:hypothetical protein
MTTAAAAIVEIPAFVRGELLTNLSKQITDAGYPAAEAKRYATASLSGFLGALQQYIDSQVEALAPGEELVIDWDKAVNARVEIDWASTKAQSSDAAAVLEALKGLQGNSAPKTIATTPIAAKADTSGGMTPEQLAQLIGAVASAAAQGAATGAQVKPADTTMEITSQDMPVPGQLGRFRKVVRTRRVPSSSMPELRG